jgi:hypothetical protein
MPIIPHHTTSKSVKGEKEPPSATDKGLEAVKKDHLGHRGSFNTYEVSISLKKGNLDDVPMKRSKDAFLRLPKQT